MTLDSPTTNVNVSICGDSVSFDKPKEAASVAFGITTCFEATESVTFDSTVIKFDSTLITFDAT